MNEQYIARVKGYELYELIKTGFLVEGFGNDTDKPIKIIYAGKDINKPLLYFNQKALKLFNQLKNKFNINTKIIPVGDISFKLLLEKLEKDNIETLII